MRSGKVLDFDWPEFFEKSAEIFPTDEEKKMAIIECNKDDTVMHKEGFDEGVENEWYIYKQLFDHAEATGDYSAYGEFIHKRVNKYFEECAELQS